MLEESEMIESDVERIFKREVKKVDGLCYKFTSPGNAGVPDRIVIFPTGVVLFCELKKRGGKLRPLQRRVLRDMHKNHAQALVVEGLLGIACMLMYAGYQDNAIDLACKYKLDVSKVREAFNDDWWGIKYFTPKEKGGDA